MEKALPALALTGSRIVCVTSIAAQAGVPFQVLRKLRRGDYDVSVSLPDAAAAAGRTPVLVDDIVSSGRTILETLVNLERLSLPPPVVVAIHPVFPGDAYEPLKSARLARIVSTDIIADPSNAIPMGPAHGSAASRLMTSLSTAPEIS